MNEITTHSGRAPSFRVFVCFSFTGRSEGTLCPHRTRRPSPRCSPAPKEPVKWEESRAFGEWECCTRTRPNFHSSPKKYIWVAFPYPRPPKVCLVKSWHLIGRERAWKHNWWRSSHKNVKKTRFPGYVCLCCAPMTQPDFDFCFPGL